MKRNILVRIIISSVAVIILTALLIYGLSGGGFNMFNINFNGFGGYSYPDSELYSKGNANISAEGVNKLNVDWISDSVKVETYSGNDISISETDSDKLSDDEKLRYLVKDGTLYIKFWAPRNGFRFGWNFNKKKNLTLLVPEVIADKFTECIVDTTSADMTLQDIGSEKFVLDSTSGRVKLSAKGVSKSINVETTSGDIEISASTGNADFDSTSGVVSFTGEADKITCNTTSGDLKLDATAKSGRFDSTSGTVKLKGKVDDLRCNTTSGEIVINAKTSTVKTNSISGSLSYAGETNEIGCITTSGDIEIQSDICPLKVNAGSTSGIIKLTIPENKGFTAQHDSTSGKFRCDFAVKSSDNRAVYEDGSAQFDLSSTSGDITIKKK